MHLVFPYIFWNNTRTPLLFASCWKKNLALLEFFILKRCLFTLNCFSHWYPGHNFYSASWIVTNKTTWISKSMYIFNSFIFKCNLFYSWRICGFNHCFVFLAFLFYRICRNAKSIVLIFVTSVSFLLEIFSPFILLISPSYDSTIAPRTVSRKM